jgi:hypothetical protein
LAIDVINCGEELRLVKILSARAAESCRILVRNVRANMVELVGVGHYKALK